MLVADELRTENNGIEFLNRETMIDYIISR